MDVQEVLRVPAVRLDTVPDLPCDVFSFTTDVPFMQAIDIHERLALTLIRQ